MPVFSPLPAYWFWIDFWIDQRDFRSKSIFTFLFLLISLAETGVAPQTPVITVLAS